MMIHERFFFQESRDVEGKRKTKEDLATVQRATVVQLSSRQFLYYLGVVLAVQWQSLSFTKTINSEKKVLGIPRKKQFISDREYPG